MGVERLPRLEGDRVVAALRIGQLCLVTGSKRPPPAVGAGRRGHGRQGTCPRRPGSGAGERALDIGGGQIGRASCRERVEMSVVGGGVERKKRELGRQSSGAEQLL